MDIDMLNCEQIPLHRTTLLGHVGVNSTAVHSHCIQLRNRVDTHGSVSSLIS